MAKLYFSYAAMNAGKTTILLQASHNYRERGMNTMLLTARLDDRVGEGRIGSRIGLEAAAFVFDGDTDMALMIATQNDAAPLACVLVDEAQFLTPAQVDDLLRIVVDDGIPALAYGIRTDFQTHAFPGSRRLMELAHSLEELKTICRCGRKALFNARLVGGRFVFNGDQVAIDELSSERVTYESMCAECYLRESGGLLG